MNYHHTQTAPLGFMLATTGALCIVWGWVLRAEPMAFVIAGAVGVVLIAVSFMFGSLTVEDEGDRLGVRFGPLPVFRKRIAYAEISSAEAARSSIIDGWGIHYILGRGWTYNLWGFDCVKLVVNGKVIRIGTDDVQNLLEFLRRRIGRSS